LIILFKEDYLGFIQPIVIVDYTRSDEQFSPVQIVKYSNKLASKGEWAIRPPKIFSLDYECEYTHSGITYGNALKTQFSAAIRNAPTELIKLLNIEQYSSQQNLEILRKAINNIIDPKIIFPTGVVVLKGLNKEVITRNFIVYSTPYNFDNLRVNSFLNLKGAAYDSMVIRLKFDAYIYRNQTLMSQLATILAKQEISIDLSSSDDLITISPKFDKYYAPQPVNNLLVEVCTDNNLTFVNENDSVKFISLSPDSPPNQLIKQNFTFRNSVANSKMISSFSLNNYVSCEFETEMFDPELFSSVHVYDDTDSSIINTGGVESSLFSNLSKSPGIGKYSAYRFYVQEYTLHDSRYKTTAKIKGTNNWLLNNFKLDHMLEYKIYSTILNPTAVP